jgi:hypothetical protein
VKDVSSVVISALRKMGSVRELGAAPADFGAAQENVHAHEVIVIQHRTLSRRRDPVLLAVIKGVELPE